MKKQDFFIKKLIILCLLSFFAFEAFGGTTLFKFAIRKQFSGRYDIKMIAAPNLEPAYIDSAQAIKSIIKVDSIINPQTILTTNTLLDINNQYKSFPKKAAIPLPALLCPSTVASAPCPAAYTVSTSGSCPGGKWSLKKAVNRYVSLVYPDYDTDVTTFSSSYATLDIPSCAEVEAAYLYWAGFKQGSNTAVKAAVPTASYTGSADIYSTGVSSTADYQTIKLKCPGMTSYADVNAITTYESSDMGNTYICVGDVTSIVKGKSAGKYWVANIRSYPDDDDGGSSSGWTMVIIYKSQISAPRALILYDGVANIKNTTTNGVETIDYEDFNLTGITAPSTSNFKSYLGYAVLDGENSAAKLMGNSNFTSTPTVTQLDGTSIPNNSPAECVQFSANGAPSVYLNPFYGDTIRMYTNKAQPADASGSDLIDACKIPIYKSPLWGYGFDGASSSRISTYDETTNTNGNEIDRKPSGRYTMGYDSHMMLLPKTAISSSTTSATMRIYAGSQGGTTPFMAFIAIETNQPRLLLYKKAINTSSSVTLGDQITYQLKIKNLGSLASTAGDAYIYDTLGMQSDFVPGSVTWVLGSGSFTASGTGTDKEPLAFTNLPSIASGDSVVITYKVSLEPLTRTDIWGVTCRRVVRNRGYLYYKPDATYTSPISTMSNGGSCGETGADAEVYVVDPVNFPIVDAKLKITRNISSQVVSNPGLLIVDAVRSVLTDSAGVTNASSYTIKDASLAVVSPTATFNTSNAIQTFTASIPVDNGIGGTCDLTYTITLILGKVPTLTLSSTETTCKGSATGSVNIKAKEGSSTETYEILTYAGTYTSIPTTGTALADVFYPGGSTVNVDLGNVTNLGAGTYTVFAKPTNNLAIPTIYQYVTVSEPDAVTDTVVADHSSVCAGDSVSLTATINGGLSSGTKTYAWQRSTDNATWTTIAGETSSKLKQQITVNTYFRVIGAVGICPSVTSSSVEVMANPIPVVTLKSDTSVSVSIKPTTATFHTKVTNATGTIKYAWEVSTDNGTTWSKLPSKARGTYTFASDSSSVTVSNIDTLMTGYKYRVSVTDKSTTCSSAYSEVTLTVTDGPSVTAESAKPSCAGKDDGTLTIHIKGGEPNENYTVTFSGSSKAVLPATFTYTAGSTASADRTITGPAGSYTVVLTPDQTGPFPGLPVKTKNFTIEPQTPVNITLSGRNQVCAGDTLGLVATLTGGADGGTQTYKWEQSANSGVSYDQIQISSTSSSYTNTLNSSLIFRVIGYVNLCPDTSNIVAVAALPTPKASVLPSDSGCYSFDLHNLQVVETTGINDYTVSLHSAKPTDTYDDTYLIPESNYIITKNMIVYARLTVGGLCSSTAAGSIYIKKMDQCYPIAVPEFFSPDGDGINDLFQIDNLQAYDNPEIVIYDRYGKQVFKGGKEDLTAPNGWDGKYLSKDLPSADYWYEMKFKEIKTKVGHFSIKRKKE